MPSTRTPEGDWFSCSICRKRCCVEPSTFPVEDSACPFCGSRLVPAESHRDSSLSRFVETSHSSTPSVQASFDRFDRCLWAAIGLLTAAFVWAGDQSVSIAMTWFIGMVLLGQVVLPQLHRFAGRWVSEERFWSSVAIGWGLSAGPPIGTVFGVLILWFEPVDWMCWQGRLLGLMVGPPFAAIQGLILAAVIEMIARCVFGLSIRNL